MYPSSSAPWETIVVLGYGLRRERGLVFRLGKVEDSLAVCTKKDPDGAAASH